jgi:hypothetical protein
MAEGMSARGDGEVDVHAPPCSPPRGARGGPRSLGANGAAASLIEADTSNGAKWRNSRCVN